MGGVTTVVFSRPLDTGDKSADVTITDADMVRVPYQNYLHSCVVLTIRLSFYARWT